MHDPLCVAFEIRRPWPKIERPRRLDGSPARPIRYWPAIVTVWHREPKGADSGTTCPYRTHWRHPHHWHLQVHALQELRRRLLTRCAWCGGRHSRRDRVDNSLSWDGPRGRWWQGEPGVYHGDCASISSAHVQCVCVNPSCADYSAKYGPYGHCCRCDKGRSFGKTFAQLERMRILATVVPGTRDPEAYRRVVEMAEAEREREVSV